MATEFRHSVPISETIAKALEQLRAHGSALQVALRDLLAGRPGAPDPDKSEAAALQALLAVGLEAVEERAAETGYARLAAEQDEDDAAYHKAMRDRRRGGRD